MSLFSEYKTKSLTVYMPYITIVSKFGNFILFTKATATFSYL
jgi:hypothetical protein